MIKRTISLLLIISMCISFILPVVAQKGDKGYCPTIVMPGIGQSRLVFSNSNSQGGKYAFPLEIDTSSLLKSVSFSILTSLFTGGGSALNAAVESAVSDIIEPFKLNDDGSFVNEIEAQSYYYPYSHCNEDEKKYINSNIPFERITQQVRDDYLYYFAYNFFAAPYDNAQLLNEYIQTVKAQTGERKVNILAGSQGATILTAYLDEFGSDCLNKVVYIVPAIQGSSSASDIYLNRFNYDDKILYDKLFNSIFDDGLGDVISVLFRLIPKSVFIKLFESIVNQLIEDCASNSAGLIAFIPPEHYQQVAQMHLSGPESAQLRAQTDKYYNAQSNINSIISDAKANGVKFFNICGYDSELFALLESGRTNDSDQIVDLKYGSIGATVANIGETLPSGYTQQNLYCTCGRNHISPDNRIDASTGILCDTTWFFKGQVHGVISRNDVIITLATKILSEDSIINVYSDKNFPQFNEARESNKTRGMISQANEVDAQLLSQENARELQEALAECENLMNNTVVNADEFYGAQDRLENILIKIGEIESNEKSETIKIIFRVFSLVKNILLKV